MHVRAFLVVLALAMTLAAGGGRAGYAASLIAVNCTTDPNALATALVTATDGDTLAIQGTCKGTFEIAHSLTLTGSSGATLDGQSTGTVLTVDSATTVGITALTINGGSGSTAGGILNNGALTLADSTVSGNSASPGTSPNFGAGGIFNLAASLTLTNSTVSGNTASVASGRNGVGGIFNLGGSLTLTDSAVSGNTASSGVMFSTTVGGIGNCCSRGSSVTLRSSTVSGNSGDALSGAFGGILNSGSVVTATNSTVSANRASATGGASAFSSAVAGVSNSGGSLALTNATLARNSVSEPNGGFLPAVGGVSNFFGGNLTVQNSLISGQSGGPNCYGLASGSDGGYNLDDGTSCGFSAANHSLSSTDPLLDPVGLNENGGPTETIALMSGSPAIDAIPPATSGCGTTISTDQRGISRPQGSGCDLGAFEFVVTTLTVAIDIKPGEVPNPINSGSGGTIPVAILSNSGFSAPSQVDTTSLEFGRTGNESSLAFCSPPQDVNGDGVLDRLCHFSTQKTGFQSGDSQGVLTGKTIGGTPIRGADSVVIVPPK